MLVPLLACPLKNAVWRFFSIYIVERFHNLCNMQRGVGAWTRSEYLRNEEGRTVVLKSLCFQTSILRETASYLHKNCAVHLMNVKSYGKDIDGAFAL